MKLKLFIILIAGIALFLTVNSFAEGDMEGKGSMMEHKGSGMDRKGSMIEEKGSMMEDKGSMMEHKGSMMGEHSELQNVGNKICPVSGKVIAEVGDGNGIQVEHEGKIYNLCCAMCAKSFKKNPGKYSKIAEEEVSAK